jgi:hypothetical protein
MVFVRKKDIDFALIFVDITGDIKASIFLNQLVYWSDKAKRKDGFIYKTDKELSIETRLSLAEIKRIKPILENLGFIKTMCKKANGAPTTHYLVHIANKEKAIKQYGENHQMDKSESNHSDLVKSDQSLTEITTENTQQNTTVSVPVVYTSVFCSAQRSINEANDTNNIDYYNSRDDDNDDEEDITWLEDEVLRVCGVSSLSIKEKEQVRLIGNKIYHDEEGCYRKFSTPSYSPDRFEIRYIRDKLKWADGIWFKEGRWSPNQILNSIEKPENKEKWRRFKQYKDRKRDKSSSVYQPRFSEADTLNVYQYNDRDV